MDKIKLKIAITQAFLQRYTKSALELGEMFKEMAEKKFKKKFIVELGDVDCGAEYIGIYMLVDKELGYEEEEKWDDKFWEYEDELKEKYPTKGIYIGFGIGKSKEGK